MKEHLLKSWAVAFAEEQVDKLIKEELAGTNQSSLFRSRDWSSANQGPVFPGSVSS